MCVFQVHTETQIADIACEQGGNTDRFVSGTCSEHGSQLWRGLLFPWG